MVAVALPNPTGDINVSYFGLGEAVILLWGDDSQITVRVFTRSNRLFRRLNQLGRRQVPLRMVVQGERRLSDESLAALNLFLRYGKGLRFQSGDRMGKRLGQKLYGYRITHWGWADFQEQIRMRWIPLVR